MKQSKILKFALFGLLLALMILRPFGFVSAKPTLTGHTEPIHVIGRMSVTLDQAQRAKFNQLTHILLEETTQIDQPTLFTCNEDINTPGTFVWDEIWSSKTALDEHLASDRFKTWWSWVEPHLSGSLQINYVNETELKKL